MAVPYWLSRMSLMLPEAQIEKLLDPSNMTGLDKSKYPINKD